MSSYQTFAVAGAAGVGKPIIENLVLLNKRVIVLSRNASTTVAGATTHEVDYESVESLVAALKGVDVVVTTIGAGASSAQVNLAKAAKKAGVKLFLPTEFGNPTAGRTGEDSHPIIIGKAKFQDFLKEIDLPFVLVYTGGFSDLFFPVFLDFKSQKLTIVGKGDTPISWTSRHDIGYYVAHALVDTPDAKLEWSTLQLQGDLKSFNEIVAIWERLNPGSKIDITHTSIEDATRAIATGDFFSWILLAWEKGLSNYTPVDSKRWPEYKPQTVEDILKTIV